MGFSNAKRLVAFAVLMIVVSDAIAQLQGCNGKSGEDCTVQLASFGFDDSAKYGHVRTSGGSSEDVLVLDQEGKPRDLQRGFTIMELDVTTCTTKNRQNFDTYSSIDARTGLLGSLELKRAGTVIVGVTADTPENNDNDKASLRKVIGPFFRSYGMDLSGLKFRDKLVFIMEKGNPNKTVFKIRPNGGESLTMKIAVRCSIVRDVTFKQM